MFVVVAAFSCYKGEVLAVSQSEGEIPQSGDLCGGTGGNGQIVSMESNAFTIKRNDDDSNQIIHLTGQTTIKTSTDAVTSISDLKTGDRVTLIGGLNRDGSFTANTVVLCTVIQEIQSGQKRIVNFNKANVWRSYMNVSAIFLVSLIWIGITVFLRLKKKKSLVYLLFFTILYFYIVTVLNYTLYQYQSLIILSHFTSNLMLHGLAAGKSLNLIPIITLTPQDLKTSLLNILLMMPFGFGLPFLTDFRMKKIVFTGFLVSVVIEFLQFVTGFVSNTTFRIADVNDLIFNTIGVAIGYILFIGSIHIFRHISQNWKISANPILRYITERPQVDR
jgi:glycopeptide antibiotics resistance protein